MKFEIGIENSVFESNVDEKSIDFSFNEEMVFDILQNRLYKHKIRTLTQEYLSNGRDACREAGRENIPLRVTLPTMVDPVLKIRDFGVGMTEDRAKGIFTRFGSSTKRADNKQTGGFGIGSKSAFSYTDHFTVVTYVDGIAYSYLCHISQTKRGQLTPLGQTPTTELNGTEIQITLKDPKKDIKDFVNAVFRATIFWDIQPEILGILPEEVPAFYKTGIINPLFSHDNWKIYPANTLNNFVNGGIYGRENLLFIVDGIPYSPPTAMLNDFEPLKKIKEFINNDYCLTLNLATGDVHFASDRENIEGSDYSIAQIQKFSTELLESLTNFFNKYNSEATDIHELAFKNASSRRIIKGSVGRKSIKVNGLDVIISPEHTRFFSKDLTDCFLIERFWKVSKRGKTKIEVSHFPQDGEFTYRDSTVLEEKKINVGLVLLDVVEGPRKKNARIRKLLESLDSKIDSIYLLTPTEGPLRSNQSHEDIYKLLEVFQCKKLSSIEPPVIVRVQKEKIEETVVPLNFFNFGRYDVGKKMDHLDLEDIEESQDEDFKQYVYYDNRIGLSNDLKSDKVIEIAKFLDDNNYKLCSYSSQKSLSKIKDNPMFIDFFEFKLKINEYIPLDNSIKEMVLNNLWKGAGNLDKFSAHKDKFLDPEIQKILSLKKENAPTTKSNLSIQTAKFLYGIEVEANIEIAKMTEKVMEIEKKYPILKAFQYEYSWKNDSDGSLANSQIVEYINLKYKESLQIKSEE
jgi:hypothetical protein